MMHPRIAELFGYLDRERVGLETAISGVPVALRATSPADDQWSVTQVVDHLVTVERRIGGLLSKQISEAIAAGLPPERDVSPILAGIDSRRIVDRTTRFASGMQPSGSVDTADSLRALDTARDELKAAVLGGDGLDLSAISAPHRFFGPLTMYEWIAFVASHTRRHADQIREIGATLSAVGP